ncbi:hypothetical protein FQZ97_1027330 [compost metagenome]
MKPSTTITRLSSAACSTAPTSVAISKPPNAASAASGSLASGWRASTWRRMPILRCTASASSPVPAPVQSATDRPARRASSIAAAEVLPIPISPSSSALPGRPRTRAAPLASASSHCAALMAGPSSASAVPGATLLITRPGRGAKSWRTPQSTTVRPMPCCRASTLTAAPPARKFSTICQVTSLG